MSLEMAVGSSSHADVSVAGEEAARQVLEGLLGRRPDLVLVFSSIRFADPRMLRSVRQVTGGSPLVGCTDAGGIVTSGPKRRSVTVVGLIGHECEFATAVERQMSAHPRISGERVAENLLHQATLRPACVLAFPDGLSASGSEVLTGLEKKLGVGIPVAGATAGDDLFYQKTFQFFNDEILSDSVTAVMMAGQATIGIGVRHGWVPVGRPRRVTRASGNIVYQLDGKPAVSIYEDFLGIKRAELMQEPLASVTLTYPMGSPMPGNAEFMLRDAIRVGRGGSLICTGNIEQGADIRLMIGGYESALEASKQAACEAVEQMNGCRMGGALVFCSVARQKMLGSEFQGEIDVIRDALGGSGVRFGGFYSYGEIAPSKAYSGLKKKNHSLFHNESAVVVALG